MTQRLGRLFPVRQLRSPLRQDLRVCADAAERFVKGRRPATRSGRKVVAFTSPALRAVTLSGIVVLRALPGLAGKPNAAGERSR